MFAFRLVSIASEENEMGLILQISEMLTGLFLTLEICYFPPHFSTVPGSNLSDCMPFHSEFYHVFSLFCKVKNFYFLKLLTS